MNKVSFVALLLSSAFVFADMSNAADYAPPPPVDELRPATYDWSGLYVGAWTGNACFGGGYLVDGANQFELDGCSMKAGIEGGYNYQIQDWVLGVEVDYGWSTGKFQKDYHPIDVGDDFTFNSIGTARAKLGYALMTRCYS